MKFLFRQFFMKFRWSQCFQIIIFIYRRYYECVFIKLFIFFFIHSSIRMMIEELCVKNSSKKHRHQYQNVCDMVTGDGWTLKRFIMHAIGKKSVWSSKYSFHLYYKFRYIMKERNIIYSVTLFIQQQIEFLHTYFHILNARRSTTYIYILTKKKKKKNLVSLSKRIFNGVLCVLRIFTFL